MRSWLRKLCAIWAVGLAFGCAAAVAAPAAGRLDTLEQRVQPCMACHGKEGRATSEGFYPRIAGKPAGYLFNQLVNFRAGRRRFPMMVYLTTLLDEPYLKEMAEYFAGQHVPYPPPSPPGVGADVLERGRQLVMQGDSSLRVPACRACHGAHLLGVDPDVPGLLGLSRDYLVAQLTAWRIGARSARAPDCMAEIVHRLRPTDVNAATAWLASQPVPPDASPEPSFAQRPPLQCGSFEPGAATPAPVASKPAPVASKPAPVASKLASGAAQPGAAQSASEVLQRGRELVTLGGCHACHTAIGGAAFAGGRAIPTPFGTFYSPNITPDTKTGIGRWSAEDFWRALHEGVSPDGTLLYPAFPYTNYTRVSRADADAMYAYLESLPAVAQPDHPQEVRFPYDMRTLLAGWRFLYFRPGEYRPDPARSAEWNRGAYLVQGLGHCSACHESRNSLGATRSGGEPAGGLVLSWYAPSLHSSAEAGVQGWRLDDIVRFLAAGEVGGSEYGGSPVGATDASAGGEAGASRDAGGTPSARHHAVAMGPMAEVVDDSLQYADAADLRAMAVYLRSLPDEKRAASRVMPGAGARTIMEYGRKIYADQCAGCHGDHGEGRAPAGPPLAGNRMVTMPQPADLVRILLFGGYPPGTRGDPRPFGMPPFYPSLSDDQLADVLTYIRLSWGNAASPVFANEFAENRGSPLW